MQASNGNNNLPMSEINVTPLVDVMLVLLIIFMLTAPHLEQGVDVALPQVTAEAFPAKTADEAVITVTRDEQVLVSVNEVRNVKVPISRLEAQLREAVSNKPVKDIYLRADKNVPYGVVVRVMAAVKNAGVPNLGMVTEPEEIKSP